MGLTHIQGRFLTEQEVNAATHIAAVNQAFVAAISRAATRSGACRHSGAGRKSATDSIHRRPDPPERRLSVAPIVRKTKPESFSDAALGQRRNEVSHTDVQRIEVAAAGDMADEFSYGKLEFDLEALQSNM